MPKFHVTYSYLCSGMEGRADRKDYGIVEAQNSLEAALTVVYREYPAEKWYGPGDIWAARDFFRCCLKVEEVE